MRVVPARNGWSWVVKGFAMFRKNPPMWLFLVLAYALALSVLHKVRYLGPSIALVLLPVFSVSFMFMCAVLEKGGALHPALLISGFRSRRPTLMVLGLLYLLSIAAALGLASLADAGALLVWFLLGQPPSLETLQDPSFASAALIASLATAPVMMAFWFAPVLAAWNRIGAAQSLFYSFFAVWRNWRAFLVYGAVITLAGLAILMLVGIVSLMLQADPGLAQSLALVLTFPTLFASFYASYRDVFPENAVPAGPPTNARSS
jgi:hypothetical protein